MEKNDKGGNGIDHSPKDNDKKTLENTLKVKEEKNDFVNLGIKNKEENGKLNGNGHYIGSDPKVGFTDNRYMGTDTSKVDNTVINKVMDTDIVKNDYLNNKYMGTENGKSEPMGSKINSKKNINNDIYDLEINQYKEQHNRDSETIKNLQSIIQKLEREQAQQREIYQNRFDNQQREIENQREKNLELQTKEYLWNSKYEKLENEYNTNLNEVKNIQKYSRDLEEKSRSHEDMMKKYNTDIIPLQTAITTKEKIIDNFEIEKEKSIFRIQ